MKSANIFTPATTCSSSQITCGSSLYLTLSNNRFFFILVTIGPPLATPFFLLLAFFLIVTFSWSNLTADTFHYIVTIWPDFVAATSTPTSDQLTATPHLRHYVTHFRCHSSYSTLSDPPRSHCSSCLLSKSPDQSLVFLVTIELTLYTILFLGTIGTPRFTTPLLDTIEPSPPSPPLSRHYQNHSRNHSALCQYRTHNT